MNARPPSAVSGFERLDPNALRKALLPFERLDGRGPETERRDAAVSLIIRWEPEPDFLLIKRARHERDPWSGHMALPGGRRDTTDKDLIHTAIRETEEETGLSLTLIGEQPGRLPVIRPTSQHLPPVSINPFVFSVPPGVGAEVTSPEVDKVFWIPAREFLSPTNHGPVEVEHPSGRREFPAFQVAGEVVWGITHRILSDFLTALGRRPG